MSEPPNVCYILPQSHTFKSTGVTLMLLKLLGAVTWPSTAFVAVCLLPAVLHSACLVLDHRITEWNHGIIKVEKDLQVHQADGTCQLHHSTKC